jgi:MFS family permease
LVTEERLVAANSLNSLSSNLARLVGPAPGAVIAAFWGLSGIVLADAVSFALAALFLAFAITNLGEGVMGTLYPVFVNQVLHGVAPQIGELMTAQASSPDGYRGRIFGLLGATFSLLSLIGIVVASTITDRVGVVRMLNIQGIGYIVGGLLLLWLLPRRRTLESQLERKRGGEKLEVDLDINFRGRTS